MGQQRHNDLAILNIERWFTNKVVLEQMDEIINILGKGHERNSSFSENILAQPYTNQNVLNYAYTQYVICNIRPICRVTEYLHYNS